LFTSTPELIHDQALAAHCFIRNNGLTDYFGVGIYDNFGLELQIGMGSCLGI
jgi:hypothetical protein